MYHQELHVLTKYFFLHTAGAIRQTSDDSRAHEVSLKQTNVIINNCKDLKENESVHQGPNEGEMDRQRRVRLLSIVDALLAKLPFGLEP